MNGSAPPGVGLIRSTRPGWLNRNNRPSSVRTR